MRKNYHWPDLTGKRTLVVGIGGGCDAIMAYAVAKDLVAPLTKSQVVVYGNTVGPREMPNHLNILGDFIKAVCKLESEELILTGACRRTKTHCP